MKGQLFIYIIIPLLLSGCYLTRAVLYTTDEQANYDTLLNLHAATTDSNYLYIDYSIKRRRKIWSADQSATQTLRKCGKYYVNESDASLDAPSSHSALGKPWPEIIKDEMPFINLNNDNVVYQGGRMLGMCFGTFPQHDKSYEKVEILTNSSDPQNSFSEKFIFYKTLTPMYASYYFLHRDAAQNNVHVTGLESPTRPYTPWYGGPMIVVTFPLAFAVDVVTFPIQMIILGIRGDALFKL